MSGSSLDEVEGKLNNDLQHLKAWFDENELLVNLKKGKTESMIFGTAKRLGKTEKKEVKVEVNGTSIAETLSYKYLGVHLDQTMNFATHFDKIYKLLLLVEWGRTVGGGRAPAQILSPKVKVVGWCGAGSS